MSAAYRVTSQLPCRRSTYVHGGQCDPWHIMRAMVAPLACVFASILRGKRCLPDEVDTELDWLCAILREGTWMYIRENDHRDD
jgi:hypothetical protein